MIVILSSEPGMGKTYQCAGWEEPILYLDLENRAQKTIDRYYKDKIINLKQCLSYTKEYKEDHVRTLEIFQGELNELKDVSTIVIDGISEIRDYCHTKWARDNKRKRAVNPGDWEQVNDMVRAILFPLINRCRSLGIHLIMTAQFKDDYALDSEGKSTKVGRIPALKEWQTYNVDTLIILTYAKPHYRALCTKSLVGCWDETITGKNLYEILIETGV